MTDYFLSENHDLSTLQFISDDECFISPVVEVLAPARTETSAYILKLPHCLDEGHDRNKVKVRMINEKHGS